MSLSFDSDRRNEPRMNIECGVKVYDPRAQRYYAGRTVNVSAGGALIELQDGLGGLPGDAYEIVVNWVDAHPLLCREQMQSVRLVRRDTDDSSACRIALRYDEPMRATHAA